MRALSEIRGSLAASSSTPDRRCASRRTTQLSASHSSMHGQRGACRLDGWVVAGQLAQSRGCKGTLSARRKDTVCMAAAEDKTGFSAAERQLTGTFGEENCRIAREQPEHLCCNLSTPQSAVPLLVDPYQATHTGYHISSTAIATVDILFVLTCSLTTHEACHATSPVLKLPILPCPQNKI